eukprot:308694-Amphidinium_carterae.1
MGTSIRMLGAAAANRQLEPSIAGLTTSAASLKHHVIGACANHRRWQLALHMCEDAAGATSSYMFSWLVN